MDQNFSFDHYGSLAKDILKLHSHNVWETTVIQEEVGFLQVFSDLKFFFPEILAINIYSRQFLRLGFLYLAAI